MGIWTRDNPVTQEEESRKKRHEEVHVMIRRNGSKRDRGMCKNTCLYEKKSQSKNNCRKRLTTVLKVIMVGL